ncbi:DUF6056 family protein [Enterococcus hermanniensis]|uniref:Uncharacterized protein n=1 Tax=Enterococcus hermanniensis TaxID=249189 RepID=A0A1L8TL62_9ENTE|nr:DUF6056 family protein [Enterococcus hermanniensis]OJG45079.1 hypothetical protein RV04_GL002393 [Enterococcus hermanniensis]
MESLRGSNAKKKKISKKYVGLFLALVISLILVALPIFFTPVSSDDFIYVAKIPHWSNLMWRYMHWSGRIVADSASLLLLQLPSIIYKIIKSIIWIALIFLISQLPYLSKEKYKFNVYSFIIVFLLYWIANPNLGQTSFWTVGYTNYLLTNFFIITYFSLIFFIKDKKISFRYYFFVGILGLLAGNSNENTSIVVVLLTIVFFIIENNKKIFIVGLPFTIIGTLTLLLSPGQHERLQHASFQILREQSLLQRLWNYFSSPWFIETFQSFSWVFVGFILIGFIYFFKHQIPKKNNVIYSIIFFFAAIIANAAFGGSYAFPVALRSLNGALILFLVALSFLSADISYSEAPLFKRSIIYVIIILCVPFIISYYYATKSVVNLNRQFQIREAIIIDGKKDDLKKIYIPNYYVGKLYNPSDSIDLYQGDLKSFYKVNSSTSVIQYNKDFSFDYGNKKLINSKQIPLNRSFGRNINLKALNIFSDGRNLNNFSVNLTFDNNLLEQYSPNDFILFIHVNWKREAQASTVMFNADTSLNNQLNVDGKYIFSSPIGNIRPKDIDSIDIGLYNSVEKTNYIETNINIENKYK